MSASLAPSRPADAPAARAGSPGVALAIIAVIVLLDQWTKHLAVQHLPRHLPREVFGEYVRFTLTYNPGAAFGMHLGDASRWIFTFLTLLILGFLVRLYAGTPRHDTPLRLAVATVMGGAVGNLVDRLRSAMGVVDFIDVGVGDTRFWTFNVADTAVSLGAIALVLLLWRRDLQAARVAQARAATAGTPAGGAPAAPESSEP